MAKGGQQVEQETAVGDDCNALLRPATSTQQHHQLYLWCPIRAGALPPIQR